ncbi:GlcNAc-PI de-N-acetylase [Paenibacillus sp. FSL A5-0031]|uniref:PIG-L deacetylase family protein n=1 Tax=unclassified Paenibacillus TaxID=185978 RepID=UPI00096ECAB6|nr:PIG-L deacetylase family protein [Paenibacillus sp. FSL A5-0031]OME82253.1 GlcNAc-PI de-N-acetylase [Paenibacillus sp. FSL A5-0031]
MSTQQQKNIIVIAAHPDEPEIYAGGTSALFAEMGHRVKFVSLTNGDCGHYSISGQELVDRRTQEAYEAARRLGVLDYSILNISDGRLTNSFEVREEVIRQIRNWKADVVITFHPEGAGHVDNRNAGRIVRDAADFIAKVPNSVPDAPYLEQSPLFLLMPDYGKRHAYSPDLVVDIGSVIEKKLLGCDAHASQFYEFAPWQRNLLDQVPQTWDARKDYILQYWSSFIEVSSEMLPTLDRLYEDGKSEKTKYAEPFEIADYGRRPSDTELKQLFPMLSQ